jgi:hypothetical protein
MAKRRKRSRPNLPALIQAGLSVPVALEACLRELVGGLRLGHWSYERGLHAPTVSSVIRGRRRDRTIRAVIARDLGMTDTELAAYLDPVADSYGRD